MKKKKTSTWAVEIWENSHWKVVEGGLSKRVAKGYARDLARKGNSYSIARYPHGEGASATAREEITVKRRKRASGSLF